MHKKNPLVSLLNSYLQTINDALESQNKLSTLNHQGQKLALKELISYLKNTTPKKLSTYQRRQTDIWTKLKSKTLGDSQIKQGFSTVWNIVKTIIFTDPVEGIIELNKNRKANKLLILGIKHQEPNSYESQEGKAA